MSAFSLATQDVYESPTTATMIAFNVDIPSGVDGIYFCYVIDDQGVTLRTVTATLAGSGTGIVEVGRKSDASSNHSAGVFYKPSPASGNGQAVLIQSSPPFNNRAWRCACLLVTGLSASTPFDTPVMFQPGVVASPTSCSVPSEVGDDVISVGCLDGRTVGTSDWSPAGAQFFGEWNSTGAVYLGVGRYNGAAGNVATGWAWTGGASVNASEIAFNVNTAGGGGGEPTTENMYYRRRR